MLGTGKQEGSAGWQLMKRGAVGLALFGVAGWVWRRNRDQPEGILPELQRRKTDDPM
jgi:hypothetical protein